MKIFSITIVILVAVSIIFSSNVFAAAPALPTSVQAAPFYWSEDGFGIDILRGFDLSIDAYLTPGVTEQSSNEEIIQAFLDANPDLTTNIIVADDERAQIFVAHFFEGQISEVKTSTTFSKFTPNNPFDTLDQGFSLESLPSIEKLDFYKFVNKWKDQASAQELFDVDIEVIAGDGTIIQIWEYRSCLITDYVLFKQDFKDFFGFTRTFQEEFRDKTTFQCGGFTLNTEQRESNFTTINPKDFVPEDSERVQAFAVRFDERLLKPSDPPFTTFSKFTHFEGKNQFSLESLPNKEHELFYQLVNNWIKGEFDDRFDVYVDFIIGDGTILQTWEYSNCEIIDYSTFLNESLLDYKFTGLFPPEIRDKTDFACSAMRLGFDQGRSSLAEGMIMPINLIPNKDSSAQIFVANFFGGKIPETITSTTFSKFTPNNPFDSRSLQFTLESLPSKDKQKIYQLVQDWNEDLFTESFDVNLDIVSGDGTIIQTWEYANCDIIDYIALLNDDLLVNKFNGEMSPEIRDIITFDCGSFTLNTSQRQSPLDVNEINAVNFVPDSDDSAQKFVVHGSGGLITKKYTFHTFSKFVPNSPFDPRGLGFTLESLPSKDILRNYQFIGDWKFKNTPHTPFDVDVELVTGDGTILQSWQFQKCEITDYVTYLNDILLSIRFHDGGNYEIRDKTSFECQEFYLDIEHKISPPVTKSIPDNEQRAQKFVVHFSDGMIQRPVTLTFPKFVPVNVEDLALPIPGETFDAKPQFMLSSFAQKDFMPMYEAIKKWESKSGIVSQFDVDIDVLSVDDTLIQTWHYTNCEPTNHYTTLQHSILFIPFSNEFGSEIHTNTLFDCRFLDILGTGEGIVTDPKDLMDLKPVLPSAIESPLKQMKKGTLPEEIVCKESYEVILKPNKDSAACVKSTSLEKLSQRGWIQVSMELFIPEDILTESERAESFVVRISGGLIKEEQVFNTFSNFAPLSETAKSPLSIPNYPFGSTSPHFVLEGLPSKDKENFYQHVSNWLTGTFPESFDVSIDVVSGDGTIIQTWEYQTCDFTEYITTIDERLDKIKYHGKYQSEIIDKTTIRCSGLDINPGI